MKNQVMKNQLAFNKNSLVELNDASLRDVDSGITTITTSSNWCIAGAGFLIGAAIGYFGD